MNTEFENEEFAVEVINTDVIYSQDKAMVDTQIATAKAYPRNIKKAKDNAIAIVTMDAKTAETCNYSVPRGGKAITGPSVHLAKILSQVWGNLRVEAKVVLIEQTHITSQAIAFDLETNLALKVEIKRSIMQNEYAWDGVAKKSVKTGKMVRMTEDMITVTGNAGNSIALRNAILSVIPKPIVDAVYNAALQTITGDISDANKLLVRRKEVFDGLMGTYSLKEDEILKVVGKAAINFVTGEDLVVLIGIGQAIKDGDTTADLAFRSKKDAKTGDDKKADLKKKNEGTKAYKPNLP